MHQPVLDMVVRSDDHRIKVGDQNSHIDANDIEENMYWGASNK